MSAETLRAFLGELQVEFPAFRVVKKAESPLCRGIDVALRIVTLGRQRSFLSVYYTVIGDTLYVPAGWDEVDPVSAVITLRHERIHLRQRRRWTLPGMAFLYLVPFFPLGLAYGRARIEWEAYEETLRATWELRGEAAARSPSLRAHIVRRFVGPDYGWMWPFSAQIERWFDASLERIGEERHSIANRPCQPGRPEAGRVGVGSGRATGEAGSESTNREG